MMVAKPLVPGAFKAGSKVWDCWVGSIQDPWYRRLHPRAARFIGELNQFKTLDSNLQSQSVRFLKRLVWGWIKLILDGESNLPVKLICTEPVLDFLRLQVVCNDLVFHFWIWILNDHSPSSTSSGSPLDATSLGTFLDTFVTFSQIWRERKVFFVQKLDYFASISRKLE